MSTTDTTSLAYTTALYYCLGRRDVGAELDMSIDDVHRFAELYALVRTSSRSFVPSVMSAWTSYQDARRSASAPSEVTTDHI
jgi:hypothetical protein